MPLLLKNIDLFKLYPGRLPDALKNKKNISLNPKPMHRLVEKMPPTLQREYRTNSLYSTIKLLLLVAPILIVVIFTLLWFTPSTYNLARWLSKENGPAELLTFLFLLFGGIIGPFLAWRLKSKGESFIVCCFIALFSLALFLVAMEEISWGQQLFKFETPGPLKKINEQNEFTLHNIQWLQGNSEYFHLFYGLAGVVGIWFNLYVLNKLRVPRVLAPWFLTIIAVTLFDLSNDFIEYGQSINYFTRRLSEINEMLIGFAGFAYVMYLYHEFESTSPPAIFSRLSDKNVVQEQKVKTLISNRL